MINKIIILLFYFVLTCFVRAESKDPALCGIEAASHVFSDFRDQNVSVKSLGKAKFNLEDGLRVSFLGKASGVVIYPQNKTWDASHYATLALDIKNLGDQAVSLEGILDKESRNFIHLKPGQEEAMLLTIYRNDKNPLDNRRDLFVGMNGIPGGHTWLYKTMEPTSLSRIEIRDLDGVSLGQSIQIQSIRGFGRYGLSDERLSRYFPFVDEFGQFKHFSWPNKISSVRDLQKNAAMESRDLEANPGPPECNQYGGWAKGPSFEAKGHFYTKKFEGKWWLIDPEGSLFFSQGITGVHRHSKTSVHKRQHYFEKLPKKKMSFTTRNIMAKYGADWESRDNEQSLRRLKSWGMNTLGNWSSRELCNTGRIPYVLNLDYGSSKERSAIRKDPDLLRAALKKRLQQEIGRSIDDPWCIGYFVDNELDWKELMEEELYFKIVREEIKRVAQNKLYLGSRMHGHDSGYGTVHLKALRAAAKYCDVLSFNRYRFSPSDLKMLKGLDKPVIIGEFHSGALDRGLVHNGLLSVANQKQRAYAYEHYMRQALKHPNIVGAHWFQYRDQCITGRADGENYQVGFVDICDTPNQEIISASRRISRSMYSLHTKQ